MDSGKNYVAMIKCLSIGGQETKIQDGRHGHCVGGSFNFFHISPRIEVLVSSIMFSSMRNRLKQFSDTSDH